jgi:arylsulfatase A-like enzyme
MKNLITSCLSVFFLAMLMPGCNNNSKMPNIIMVITDDQGYADISAHGSPDVLTPGMDKLESEGISLTDFHASPTCAPTRSAIMTGRHPFKNGITHTILERERMALGLTTLPEVLKRGGYTCGIFGKWHLGDEQEYQPGSRGFDEVFVHGAGGIGQAYPGSCADVPDNGYFDPVINHNGVFVKTKGFCTDVFFAQATSWIKDKLNENRPFFAYIATNAPHGPFIAPEKYKEKFKKQGYPEHAQGFYGMIENIDDNLGKLMAGIDEWGIAGNTIFIFMSDNGKTFPGGNNDIHGETYNAGMRGFKGSPYEGGTRVPFFIRWSGKFKAGREIDVLLNHYDILPTLADITNIDISDISSGMDGQSFLPYLESESFVGEERYRFVHVGRWPLDPDNVAGMEINPNWLGTKESSDPDNHKYNNCAVRTERYRFVNNSELYDLFEDPGETNNVASKYPEVVDQIREAYDKWWQEARPLMVNENVPLAKERPYWVNYYKQKESRGIPEWKVPEPDQE